MGFTSSRWFRWVVLAVAFLGVFGALGLGRFGYSAILPSMQKALALTSEQAGSLASWNLGGYVVMAVIGGLLASRFGPRRVVTVGLVVTALGMFLTGISRDLAGASAARLLTGMGSGVVNVPSVAMMSTWFEARRRGLASGIVTSGSSLGLIIVGPVVPRIIAAGGQNGWRLAWYFFAAVTVVLGLVTFLVQRDQPVNPHHPSVARNRVVKNGTSFLDWRGIYRSGYAWHLGFVYLLFGFAYMVYFTFFQKRLIHDLGYSGEAAGNLFMVLGMVSLFCGVVWGAVSDRIGRKQAIAVMCMLQAVAAALFGLWPTGPGLVFSAVLFGLTAIGLPGIVGAACGDKFGPVLAPASLGFLTLFIGVGQAAGPVLAGRMADALGSFSAAYGLAAGLFVLAAVSALLMETPSVAPAPGGCIPDKLNEGVSL